MIHTLSYSAMLAAIRFISLQFVGISNTLITPARPPYPIIIANSNRSWEAIRLAHQFFDRFKIFTCGYAYPKQKRGGFLKFRAT
jgi:hypothetical protein